MSYGIVTFILMPALFLSIMLLIEVGRKIGLKRIAEETERARAGLGTMESAIYGLLALMIAFTFSGAASRFDTRRGLTVQEANAIGTAYLLLDLLPPAEQPPLREQFRRYTEARLAVYQALPDLEASNVESAKAITLQHEIWAGVVAAVNDAPPPVKELLLPAVSDMTGISTTRAIALKTHVPLIIIGVLVLLVLLSSLLVGYGLASGKPLSMGLHKAAFAFVMTLTIYIILDLDYPRVGLIRVDFADQAMEDVRASMR
jgi:hypothetical protein